MLRIIYQTTDLLVTVVAAITCTETGSLHLEIRGGSDGSLTFSPTTKKILPQCAIPAGILWWAWSQKVSFWSLFGINRKHTKQQLYGLNGPEAFVEILKGAQEQGWGVRGGNHIFSVHGLKTS